ncbi:MAG: sulfatase-like hydrolase/transferase [Gammaproteobacteria bacterium]|nr:sulfatase-like hydrolase/transferase [Gammaproteobacteria bacterium]MDE0413671.1 sulfatase-like hydrolase/transferase [Gammaproteobacteria bacterium]
MRAHLPWLAALTLLACDSGDSRSGNSEIPEEQRSAPNILLLIADDVGVEQFASFGLGFEPAATPNLDLLAARGMQFSTVWSQPLCSPTRATLLTGRYGFRTGVGFPVLGEGVNGSYPVERPEPLSGAPVEAREVPSDFLPYLLQYKPADKDFISYGLRPDEVALPSLLRETAGYATAAIGKWHLADTRNGWLEHPGNVGFEHYSVNMLNAPESFFSWRENVNGVLEHRTGYTAQRKIDDALEWLEERDERPWLLWMAFNLGHYPLHVPELEGGDTSNVSPENRHAALDSMIARLDQEIGRLLNAMGDATLENTVVVFLGDNGTTGNVIDPPFDADRAKFTVYEGGLRVPLIIAGPGVPQGVTSDALVNTTDIFATILDLAGASLPADLKHDSKSLLPYFANTTRESIRTYLYADVFNSEYGLTEGAFAVRDSEFKLIHKRDGRELYNLGRDPYESTDLLIDGISEQEQAAIDRLDEILNSLHGSEE